MAFERAKIEGLDKDENMQDPNYEFYGKLEEYAMFKCAFYMCHKCNEPYFGGLYDCVNAEQEQEVKKEDLVCSKCTTGIHGAGVTNCPKHGTAFIDYKCRWCCNVALFYCWGSTHFCDECHRQPNVRRPERPLCHGDVSKCKLQTHHPPEGEEFALGCSLCREEALKAQIKEQ